LKIVEEKALGTRLNVFPLPGERREALETN